MSVLASLVDDARAGLGDVIDLGRRIHRRPEIGLHLPRTQETVLQALDGLGLEITTGRGPNHGNRMRIDEGALAGGVALHAAVALRVLDDVGPARSGDPRHRAAAGGPGWS